MLIPVLRDRTSKPPLGTSLRSDGHWSVQGLVGAWAFNEGAGNIAHDLRCSNNLLASSPLSPDGFVIPNNTSANTLRCGRSAALEPQNTLSVVMGVTKLGTPTNYGKLLHYGQNDSGPYGLYGIEQFAGSDGYLTFHAGLGGNIFAANTSSSVLETGKTADVAMVLGTDIKGYVNGFCVATLSTNGAPLRDDNTNSGLSIGQKNENVSNAYPAKYHYVLIYNVALKPQEVISLSANPWQIYEPELVWIEVPDGAGATHTSSANPGTVALTGSVTTTYHTYVSSADAGIVTLTGSTASDYYNRVSSAATGTVTITGNAATDYHGLVSHAGAGSVILAGSTSTDYRNLVSSADTSTVTLTRYAATDTVTAAGSYTSIAAAGTITLTGSTATACRTLISGAATGAVTLTGYAATDTITEPGAYTSEAAAGTLTISGSSATTHRSSAATSSAIQLVGSEATGYFGFTSGAEPSAVIVTGAQTSALRSWISGTSPGSVIITGYDASGVSPIYEISKIFASARLSGPTATGRITTPTTGIRLT